MTQPTPDPALLPSARGPRPPLPRRPGGSSTPAAGRAPRGSANAGLRSLGPPRHGPASPWDASERQAPPRTPSRPARPRYLRSCPESGSTDSAAGRSATSGRGSPSSPETAHGGPAEPPARARQPRGRRAQEAPPPVPATCPTGSRCPKNLRPRGNRR